MARWSAGPGDAALDASYGAVKSAADGFGLVGGGLIVTDVTTTASSTTITSASAPFQASHVGRTVVIIGAGEEAAYPASDFATVVATITSVPAADTAVLSEAPAQSLTNAETYVVADETAALQAWLTSVPSVKRAVIGGVEESNKGHGPGGHLVLPPGVYGYSGALELPQNCVVDISGVVLVALGSSAVIRQRTTSGFYEQPGATLVGKGIIEGAYLGTTGIRLAVSNQGKLSGFTVQRFTGDGIMFRECQWVTVESVTTQWNGGYGVVTTTDVSQSSNNIRLIAVRGHRNGLGGWFADHAGACWSIGSTWQFSPTGYGVHFQSGDVRGCSIIGGHLEGNKYHAFIDSTGGRPSGTTFRDVYFVIGAANPDVGLINGVERWVVNEGDATVVDAAKSQDSPTSIPTINGTQAVFQQSSSSGNLVVLFPKKIGSGITDWVCFEDGTPFRPGNSSPYNSRVAIIRRTDNAKGVTFDGSLQFVNPGTVGDLLQVGGRWLWFDSSGRLCSKTGAAPTTQDDAGRSILGTPTAP